MERPATSTLAVAALSEIGQPKLGDAREYVEPFGLTHDDVPALVELAKRWADDAHFKATSPSSAMWGPIHAWRALAEGRTKSGKPRYFFARSVGDGSLAKLKRHAHLRHHVALAVRDAIVIHQPDVDPADLRDTARSFGLLPGRAETYLADRIRRAHFSPVLRFVRDGSTYVVHRMTYRGHGGWSYPLAFGPLDRLVRELVHKVGTDDFFELM